MGLQRKSALAAVLILILPVVISARPANPSVRPAAFADMLPLGTRSFDSEDVLRLDLSRKVLSPPALRLDSSLGAPRLEFGGSPEPSRPGGALPVVLSLLIPGAGEIYMGYYKRGAALVLLEVAAWTGYAAYRQKGLDTRTEYEAYADEHWDQSRWLSEHPSGPYFTLGDLEYEGSTGAWEDNLKGKVSDNFFYMPFISRAEDKQHYYENIGKYNWFISGWDDWDATLQPPDYHYLELTDHRTAYRNLRVESNDQLENADRFIYLSIAARTYSLIETIMLARKAGDGGRSGDGGYGSTRFKIESSGWHTTRFTMEYGFK